MWQQTSLYMFPCAHVQKPHLEVYLSMKILNDSAHLQVYWIITIFQCIVLPEMGKTPIAPHSHQNYHQTVKYFIVLLIFISLIIMRLITFSYYNSHLHFLSCEMSTHVYLSLFLFGYLLYTYQLTGIFCILDTSRSSILFWYIRNQTIKLGFPLTVKFFVLLIKDFHRMMSL